MIKAKPTFISILGLVSIIGFLAVLLDSLFQFPIDAYTGAIIFIIIGAGLMIEGGIRNIQKMLLRGLTRDETTHMLAIIIGFMAVVIGVMGLPQVGAGGDLYNAMRGLLSIFAIVMIIIETWLVK